MVSFADPIQSHHGHYVQLQFDQFSLVGCSIAGVETVISIPQWKLNLDVGRSPDFAFSQKNVALSHWHLDHAGGIPLYLGMRTLNSLSSAKILVPPSKEVVTQKYLQILGELSEARLDYEVVGMKESFSLTKQIHIQAVESDHCVDSVGYCVSRKGTRLQKKYQGLSQTDLIQLKKQGTPIEESICEPVLTYSGDTRASFLESEAIEVPYLLMECSFFGDTMDHEKIRYYGHTHILDWKEKAELIQSEYVIMIHTSRRYTKQEIEHACQKYLPKNLQDRLIIFR